MRYWLLRWLFPKKKQEVVSCTFDADVGIAEAPKEAASADTKSDVEEPEFDRPLKEWEQFLDAEYGIISGIRQWIRVSPDYYVKTFDYSRGLFALVGYSFNDGEWFASVFCSTDSGDNTLLDRSGFTSFDDAIDAVNEFIEQQSKINSEFDADDTDDDDDSETCEDCSCCSVHG